MTGVETVTVGAYVLERGAHDVWFLVNADGRTCGTLYSDRGGWRGVLLGVVHVYDLGDVDEPHVVMARRMVGERQVDEQGEADGEGR